MYARILVPVDGSVASDQGLNEAIELARQLKARLRLVHIVEPWIMLTPQMVGANIHRMAEDMRSAVAALLQECEDRAKKAGVEVDVDLIESRGTSAGDWVVRKAKELDADLIVCGTHGRRGIRRMLLGSDAEEILRRAHVPVLLVRARESAAEETA